ncbi:hypothetical protein DPMN_105588 [Dreissena polymorpha]|uniref:Uncharacterized protein n=1 Tax=Dreissena polymorpha TaxID=45954 RepID=A0A9D4QHX5_DREPO|nr:hypothetical protein DPMN_105588 [Dreissena polymorpha]
MFFMISLGHSIVLKRFFESRTIAPTDNRSNAKFDKADSRSYDVLTGRTVAPTMFLTGQKVAPTMF